MPSLLYAGNRNKSDGTFNLEVASGIVPMGTVGVFTAAEVNELASSYYLNTPSSAGNVVVSGPPTVQTITIYDYPGDSVVLSFGGQSCTVPTASSGSQVQALLQALSSIGAGNCTVTGNEGGPWVVTFTGSLAGTIQAAITLSGADASATPDTVHFAYAKPSH